MVQNLFLVALGGAFGAAARYGVGIAAVKAWGDTFPAGTWIVNLVGSFLIGFLASWFFGIEESDRLRLLFITGFMGAFTTFSTFSLETVTLWQHGTPWLAALNMFGSIILGVVFCVLGLWAGRLVV